VTGFEDHVAARLRGRLSPFLVLFCFYMLTTSRERPWSDGTPIFEVAEAIVERHTVSIFTRWPASLPPGRDGRIFALSPLLPSLVHVPGAAVKRLLTRVAPDKALLWRALSSHLGPSAMSALTTLLLMGFCTEKFGRRAGLIVGAASALATTLWVYARYPYSEILQALCFTGLFVELMRVVERPTRAHALWVGAWAALLIDAKLANAPIVPGVVAWILWGLRAQWRTAARVLLTAAAIGLPLLALIPLYNWLRWRAPFDTGFGVAASLKGSENATVGLWGMFFSPNKSVFL